MIREILLAIPRTEVMGLLVFSLIILAFTGSAWLSWWKDRGWTTR